MYQKVGNKAYKIDLTNIRNLSAHLQNPHLGFKSVHVAGTNGKGSVSHMLASVLQENGLKVGLYTSPHLKDFRERIKINGKEIPEAAVVDFVEQNRPFFEQQQLSFFEMTVGLAFKYFSDEQVDVAIVEVGLGGRLDSTNIITPEVSVITNIGLDHTQMLGNTLAEIAAEKAGIIKKKVPVVVGEYHSDTFPVFKETAAKMEAPIFLAENLNSENGQTRLGSFKSLDLNKLTSDLKGSYQKKNIGTVFTALKVLRSTGMTIQSKAVLNGLKNVVRNTGLRGRWEVLQEAPKVICDTAHNREGLSYAMSQLLEEDFEYLHLVIGVVNDKDLDSIFPLFPKNGTYYFCRPNIPRGMDADLLKEKAGEFHLQGNTYNSVSEAYASALVSAGKRDVIYVGGSTFTVAEII